MVGGKHFGKKVVWVKNVSSLHVFSGIALTDMLSLVAKFTF
jgi:hypothetical protein